MKIGAAIFISCVLLFIAAIVYVELVPIYFHPKVKPQLADRFITVGPASVTVVNSSTNNWTGGTVTINDKFTQKFGPLTTNQANVFRFHDRKAARIWFDANEKVLKVTVEPEGEPPIEWLRPSR